MLLHMLNFIFQGSSWLWGPDFSRSQCCWWISSLNTNGRGHRRLGTEFNFQHNVIRWRVHLVVKMKAKPFSLLPPHFSALSWRMRQSEFEVKRDNLNDYRRFWASFPDLTAFTKDIHRAHVWNEFPKRNEFGIIVRLRLLLCILTKICLKWDLWVSGIIMGHKLGLLGTLLSLNHIKEATGCVWLASIFGGLDSWVGVRESTLKT